MDQETIKVRAYYLWQDDVKHNRHIQSTDHYYFLAYKIQNRINDYDFFNDSNSPGFHYCYICHNYLAKMSCTKCQSHICASCMLALDRCPFCRNYCELKQKQFLCTNVDPYSGSDGSEDDYDEYY